MNNYFEELFEKFNNLTDKEFDKLLVEVGVTVDGYESFEIKVIPKYRRKLQLNGMNSNFMEYSMNERKKIA